MKSARRITAYLFCALAAVSLLAGCGKSAVQKTTPGESEAYAKKIDPTYIRQARTKDSVGKSNKKTASAKIPTPASANQTLIVYFSLADNSDVDAVSSASVTRYQGKDEGYIKVLADMIAARTGGQEYAITCDTQYEDDFHKLLLQAFQEQDEDKRPVITSAPIDMDQYDTIFIGTPVWYDDMPMAMYSFFDQYDMSGKTIVPFVTHYGSGASAVVKAMKKQEKNASFQQKFDIRQDKVTTAEGDVSDWLDALGYK